MDNIQKIAFTEISKLPTGIVEESIYYVFGDRTNPDTSESIVILNGGYEIYKPNFELKRNSVPYYVIEFPIEGRGYLAINGKEHILEKGFVAGYKPGDAHHYKADPDKPFKHYFVNFSGYDAKRLFCNTELESRHLVKLYEFEIFNIFMLNIVKAAFNKNIHSFELCNSYLRTFLLELCYQPRIKEGGDSISQSKYIECIKYIDINYLKIVSVENVADAMNITPRYISKLFSKHSSTSAYRYITSLKMTKAAELLLTTMMPVYDIAMLIGYNDQYHFSKVFKVFYGLSPINYRKKYLSS